MCMGLPLLLKRVNRVQRPVLIGVDAGADALLEAGHRPDIVVIGENGLAPGNRGSDMGAVSDKALRGAKDHAIEDMVREAEAAGADAVVAVDLDYEVVGESMLMVSANGTAVRLG